MQIVDNRGRLFGKINLVDLGIILLVVAVLGVAYLKFFKPEKKVELQKVQYDVELKLQPKRVVDQIKDVSDIRDAVKGNRLGSIVPGSVSIVQAVKETQDLVNGRVLKEPVPEMYDVYFKVDAEATVTNSSVVVDGAEIRVGRAISIKGKGYSGEGYVLAVRLK